MVKIEYIQTLKEYKNPPKSTLEVHLQEHNEDLFEKYLKKINECHYFLDNMGFVRSPYQKTIHYVCLKAIIPLICGKDWIHVKERMMEYFKFSRLEYLILILLERQNGKTLAMKLFIIMTLMKLRISIGIAANSSPIAKRNLNEIRQFIIDHYSDQITIGENIKDECFEIIHPDGTSKITKIVQTSKVIYYLFKGGLSILSHIFLV